MSVQATARLRYVSIPPRKMRLVADLVKGMPVEKALDILNFTPRVAAEHIAKTLKSATANALSQEGTAQLRPEDLHVKNIMVDAAPSMKRIRFRSMGRVYRYRKRHCHLTVIIEEAAEKKAPAAEAKDKVGAADTDKAEVKPAAKKKARKTAAKKTTKKKTTAKKTATKKTAARKKAADKPSAEKKTSRKTSTKKRASGKDKE